MRAAKWICLLIGALCGAGLWPHFLWLVVAIDEGRLTASPLTVDILVPVWIILGMPGAILENQGYVTLAFVMTFWAAVGAGIARICFYAYECLQSLISMHKEAPFGDRDEDSRED